MGNRKNDLPTFEEFHWNYTFVEDVVFQEFYPKNNENVAYKKFVRKFSSNKKMISTKYDYSSIIKIELSWNVQFTKSIFNEWKIHER